MSIHVPRPRVPLETLGAGGPFAQLAPEQIEQLLQVAEIVNVPEERELIRHHHRADFFYLLIHGEVRFCIEGEGLGSALDVGVCQKPWTPIGWSGFRPPFRYATSVSTARFSELLRFRIADLQEFFRDHPQAATSFFEGLALGAEDLLFDVRERLLTNLRDASSVSHWAVEAAAVDAVAVQEVAAKQRAGEEHEPAFEAARRVAPEASFSPQLGTQENMVTNAAPSAVTLLRRAHFFEDFDDRVVEHLARGAKLDYFCRGDVLQLQGDACQELLVLADGRVRLEYTGRAGRTAVLRTLSKTGQILGWCLPTRQRHSGVGLRALRDGAVLRISADDLRRLFAVHPAEGARFGRQLLWLIGRHLRTARAHLVSESFAREVLAVENLVEQSRTELSVASPLHKLPHLLRATVTLGDALRVVDRCRSSTSRSEAHLAELCHELLAPARKEHRFFESLQNAFEEVAAAPENTSPQQLRRLSAQSFIRMFSQIPSRIAGLENLPAQPGHIFIFNHLRNHEYNTLPNGFQLTLDSHFISSMILHRHYGDPGVRVVRRSRAAEYGHQQYYDRLGHVPVYTRESDLPHAPRSRLMEDFIATASAHLGRGTNLVLAPEGTSYATEDSPGPLRAGAFRLALSVRPEPLIVPIAVANFDRRLDHSVPAAVIERPFKVSEQLADPHDDRQMRDFLQDLRRVYRGYVQRARQLSET